MATQPYPEAHFATFPEKLPELCIKASTSEKGNCPACGAPWVRVVEKEYKNQSMSEDEKYSPSDPKYGTNVTYGRGEVSTQTKGWKPTCQCGSEPIPPIVLDPFAGSGTTIRVARDLGRHAIGIDISDEYKKLATKRADLNIPDILTMGD